MSIPEIEQLDRYEWVGRDEWTVSVTAMDNGWHVHPSKGLIASANWALTLNPRRDSSFWRAVTGAYLRREWPRTERQLHKAVAECEEWCRRHNEHASYTQRVADFY